MKKNMVNVLGVMLIGSLTCAAAAQNGDGVKGKLRGVWVVVSIEAAGKKSPEELFKGQSLTFEGDKVTCNQKLNEKGEKETAIYKIDAGKKPAEIDITPQGGPEKGMTTKMIFRVDGDILKFAGKIGSKERPADFKDTDLSIMTLKRAKPPGGGGALLYRERIRAAKSAWADNEKQELKSVRRSLKEARKRIEQLLYLEQIRAAKSAWADNEKQELESVRRSLKEARKRIEQLLYLEQIRAAKSAWCPPTGPSPVKHAAERTTSATRYTSASLPAPNEGSGTASPGA